MGKQLRDNVFEYELFNPEIRGACCDYGFILILDLIAKHFGAYFAEAERLGTYQINMEPSKSICPACGATVTLDYDHSRVEIDYDSRERMQS